MHTRSVPHTRLHNTKLPRVRGAAVSLARCDTVQVGFVPTSLVVRAKRRYALCRLHLPGLSLLRATQCSRSYLEQVPAPLRDEMYEKKLADAGMLRAYPRSDAAKLGLRERPAYYEVTGLGTQSVSGGVSGTTNDTGPYAAPYYR